MKKVFNTFMRFSTFFAFFFFGLRIAAMEKVFLKEKISFAHPLKGIFERAKDNVT